MALSLNKYHHTNVLGKKVKASETTVNQYHSFNLNECFQILFWNVDPALIKKSIKVFYQVKYVMA